MQCCLQLKDMVLKFSGSSKQCRGTPGAQSFRSSGGGRYLRPYPSFIDVTGFAPANKVLGNALAGAGAAGGAARTASSDTLDLTRSNRKTPQSSGWIPSTEAAAAGDDVREWTAQVEPGVQITFGTIPSGGNDLKRIRFRCVVVTRPLLLPLLNDSLRRPLILATELTPKCMVVSRICYVRRRSREMFNKWEAQRWWGENYDRIVELYNVVTFSGRQQGCSTPASSVDDSALVGIAIATGHCMHCIHRFDDPL
jgi:hypothetical protein